MRTSEDVCIAAHVTRRQLDYWTKQHWVEPSTRRHPGSGNPRYFTDDEAKRIELMAQIVKAGIAPADAHKLTQRGEYDERGVFRACIYGHVYVEVFP